MNSYIPYYLKVPIEEIPISVCQKLIDDRSYQFKVTKDHICGESIIKKLDLCRGSSGAPIQVRDGDTFYVGGIVSSGFSCSADLPTVYTRVAAHLDWIEERVWPDEETSIKVDEQQLQSYKTTIKPLNSYAIYFPTD